MPRQRATAEMNNHLPSRNDAHEKVLHVHATAKARRPGAEKPIILFAMSDRIACISQSNTAATTSHSQISDYLIKTASKRARYSSGSLNT